MQIITKLLDVLSGQFSATNLQHFAIIIDSILGISNSVTTLSVARYSSLSYRTVQRFYALKDVNWLLVNLFLFKHFIYQKGKSYLFAADETVKGKVGKQTHGLGRFYSSMAKQVIRSVSFLVISIIDIEKEKSYILGCKQLIVNNLSKVAITQDKKNKSKKKSKTKLKGRPKGSKNKEKSEPESTSYQVLRTLLDLVQSQLKVFLPELNCFHIVLDGFYGHEDYLLLAAKNGLNIISKFKVNAHLILPYQGEQLGKGRPKTLGDKVNLDNLDEKFYISTIHDKDSNISTKVYQFEAFTPKMAGLKLNIVVMVHTHQITKQVSRNIIFTNDLALNTLKVIKYYSLRFQIEFDFRDAKQFYGLSDFKNYKETQVTNAVNIAFTMTVVGKLVLEKYKIKLDCPNMGIIDLKTVFRAQKCAEILLNNINFDHDEFLNSPQFLKIARLEAIHI
ncbi:MAG: transposase [Oligoflexus sp.]|nr:transposase [Pseudopedobacter sp.]